KLNVDYNNYSREDLLRALKDLIDLHLIQNIRNDVDNIKVCFYKTLKSEVEENKKAFIEGGGAVEDYKPPVDIFEDEFKTYLKKFKELKYDYNKVLEEEKKENLKQKYRIIDNISNLVNKKESINQTFNEFKELQKLWYDTGQVPQAELNRLWETYHHHVERFYDYININKELRDLDLKKNLEEKVKLCERADALLKEQSPIKAFKELQNLHALWRETGPVGRDKKEDIWLRFKETTSIINKAHQQHYESIREGQKKNFEEKTALCEKIEEIALSEINSHKDWDKKSKEIIDIQKKWKTIGFAPPKDNNDIYKRFREGCDKFFSNKRDFYASNKKEQTENLNKKTELCLKAEALQDNTDWKETTSELINIQKEWKKIGPVSRKHSDAIWKKFRKACDTFFERKSLHMDDKGGEEKENLRLKEEIIGKINKLASSSSEDHNKDIEELKIFQEEWKKVGYVPYKAKDAIQKKYNEAVENVYSSLVMDESSKELLKFRQKVERISGNNMNRGLFYEREKMANKLRQVESEIVLWDNNIGFFAKSASSEAMIKDFRKKIEEGRKNIELLKGKIKIIDSFESKQR
ncbi:DUF349 domain-containing protein, partial [Bacteroidota bacterium]